MKTYLKFSLAFLMMVSSTWAMAQNVLVNTQKSYSNIKRIEVESGWLNVSYTGGGSAEVSVEAYLESNYTDQDIVFVTVGDVLKISHTKKQNNYSWNSKNKGYIHMTGPQNIEIDFRGSSGNMTVENAGEKSTSLRVSSGNVTANQIKGDLIIKATSGNLNVNGVEGNVQGGVTSGNANFFAVKGNLDYESTSGSLEADGVGGQISVSLTSGNAKINNAGQLGFLQFTSGNVRATNSGLGPNTRFNGTSGNFRVQTNSDLKGFNYSLKSSSGNLKVGTTSTGKSLEIDNGASTTVRGNITSGNITIEN